MMAAIPLPTGVTASRHRLGGIPAAVEDVLAAYQGLLDSGRTPSAIAFAGESAGAGLLVQTLVALKAADCRSPSSAVLISPWVDLTLSGQSITDKAAVDPALTPAGLRRRAADVDVTLEVTPEVPHVFQGFAANLDEGDAALTRAGDLLRAHLATGQRT